MRCKNISPKNRQRSLKRTLIVASLSAPASIKARKQLVRPFSAARISGVHPRCIVAQMSAGNCMRPKICHARSHELEIQKNGKRRARRCYKEYMNTHLNVNTYVAHLHRHTHACHAFMKMHTNTNNTQRMAHIAPGFLVSPAIYEHTCTVSATLVSGPDQRRASRLYGHSGRNCDAASTPEPCVE